MRIIPIIIIDALCAVHQVSSHQRNREEEILERIKSDFGKEIDGIKLKLREESQRTQDSFIKQREDKWREAEEKRSRELETQQDRNIRWRYRYLLLILCLCPSPYLMSLSLSLSHVSVSVPLLISCHLISRSRDICNSLNDEVKSLQQKVFSLRNGVTELSAQVQDESRQIRLDSVRPDSRTGKEGDAGFDVEDGNVLLSRFQIELDEKIAHRRRSAEREADDLSALLAEERRKLEEEERRWEKSSEERKNDMTVGGIA
jgi:hypothetical protein